MRAKRAFERGFALGRRFNEAVSARAERSHTASRCAPNVPSSLASRSGVDSTLDIIPSPASG